MALARWQASIVDDAGNVVPNASIEVRQELPGQALVPLFSDRDGLVQITNPFNADAEGFAAFHVIGGSYHVRATSGAFERIWRFVDVGTARSVDVESLSGDITFPGFVPDAVVDTITERDAFNNETRGFSVIVNLDETQSPPVEDPHVYFLLEPGSPAVWSDPVPFASGGGGGLGTLYGIVSQPMANVLSEWEARESEGTARPRAARRAILDDLLGDLEDNGVLAKLDILYVFAGHDRQNVLFDMVTPMRAIAGATGANFNTDLGFTGNGVDAEITYPFSAADFTNFTQSSAHIGCYVLLEIDENASILGNNSQIYLRPRDAGVIEARLNSSIITQSDPVPSSIGHTVVNRPNSTTVDFFKNGVAVGTAVAASEPVQNNTMRSLVFGTQFSTQRVSLVHAGSSLTTTDIENLYLAVSAYLQEVGAVA